MDNSSEHPKSIQWKWVVISFILFVVFYLLPIIAFSHISNIFLGVWVFAGIIVIAGIAAFFSKGVTIWEPAIAASILVIMIFAYAAIRLLSTLPIHRISVFQMMSPLIIVTLVVFLLSLLGAWLGERAQKLWKSPKPDSTDSTIAP
jgi:hypothetical protein